MPQYIEHFKGRKSIAAFFNSGGPCLVAGTVLQGHQGLILRDVSGTLPLPDELTLQPPCWAALAVDADGAMRVHYQQPIDASPEVADLHRRHDVLTRRFHIHQAVRSFFLDAGFLETDTPVAVANPGMEPYLDTWPIANLWLRTSPEHHLKRLLAGGFDRIFQMGPCFRKGDVGSLHREEFHMLEWYRAFADLNALMDDMDALFRALASFASDPDYFQQGADRQRCDELFRHYLALDLVDNTNRAPLQQALQDRGIPVDPTDDWDTLYFLLFLNFIEPHLGKERPLIVTHYPASQAALAKKAPETPGRMPSCYRFEVYLRGVELANAFYELTDATEQRARFEADNQTRQNLGKPQYPVDEPLLAALSSGLPPTAGIALGLDRLALALMEHKDLNDILPFKVPRP